MNFRIAKIINKISLAVFIYFANVIRCNCLVSLHPRFICFTNPNPNPNISVIILIQIDLWSSALMLMTSLSFQNRAHILAILRPNSQATSTLILLYSFFAFVSFS